MIFREVPWQQVPARWIFPHLPGDGSSKKCRPKTDGSNHRHMDQQILNVCSMILKHDIPTSIKVSGDTAKFGHVGLETSFKL
jgi:hypothetical protein